MVAYAPSHTLRDEFSLARLAGRIGNVQEGTKQRGIVEPDKGLNMADLRQ